MTALRFALAARMSLGAAACGHQGDAIDPEIPLALESIPATSTVAARYRLQPLVNGNYDKSVLWAAMNDRAFEVCGEERRPSLPPIEGATEMNTLTFECKDVTPAGRTLIRAGEDPNFPTATAGTRRRIAWTAGDQSEYTLYDSLLGAMIRDAYVVDCGGKGFTVEKLLSAVERRKADNAVGPIVHVALYYRCNQATVPAT